MVKKYLILPDVHLRHELVETIIKQVSPDFTILLGDYWDDFDDNADSIIETSYWFRESINNKARLHLIGNHDIHYWFKDNKNTRCSGYEQYKSIIIHDIVKDKDWEKLKFFHVLDNKWLLSHAGFHPSWLNPVKYKSNVIESSTLEFINKKLNEDSIYAKINLSRNQDHWFCMPGFSRSYRSPYYGGLIWCDWNEEFYPIRGIHQICGHTPNEQLNWLFIEENGEKCKKLPLESINNPILTNNNSYNICLDSKPGSKYFAIYEDGNLSIHNTDDFIKN